MLFSKQNKLFLAHISLNHPKDDLGGEEVVLLPDTRKIDHVTGEVRVGFLLVREGIFSEIRHTFAKFLIHSTTASEILLLGLPLPIEFIPQPCKLVRLTETGELVPLQ